MDNVTRLLMQGAAGAAGGATYVDDVFSTYLYSGTAGSQSINTGLDMTEGGLTWIKVRTQSGFEHALFDTERGNNVLQSNSNIGQVAYADGLTSFNNNGFTLGADTSRGIVNQVGSGWDYASWSFRKAPGFFDVVTWTGTGSYRTLDHNLGCVPGFIMLKKTSGTESWICWHRFMGSGSNAHYLKLDTTAAMGTDGGGGSNPNASVNSVSSTQFTVGADNNGSGGTWVAYLFAGGESTAATAPSVDFNGSSYLDIADHSDFTFGTDDFTIECWYKADDTNLSSNWDYIFSSGWPVQLGHTVDGANTNSRFSFYFADSNSTSSYLVSNLNTGNGSVSAGQWYHVAVTRSGSTFRIFLNGDLKDTATSSGSAPAPNANSAIGRFTPSSPYYYADGKVSNFRYVKGTAVYTSSFKPPTEPLTAITNTKLLCCNSSSVTGSTVTPGTITNNSATASTDSPFDDPEGFKFGEGGDQNLIKCGSYVGQSGANTVNLAWEPQWVIVKNIDSVEPWVMVDSMRGWANQSSGTAPNAVSLKANSTSNESAYNNWGPTSTGWELDLNNREIDQNEQKYIYIAIRRPDGLVGKPAEVGTDVFAMDDTANSSAPRFTSGFPVDFSLTRNPTVTGTWESWHTGARLLQGTYQLSATPNTWSAGGNFQYDYNDGMFLGSGWGGYMSWMWKRGAGFDTVAYTGTGDGSNSGPNTTSQILSHSLGRPPEMIWVKCRSTGYNWYVYHSGQNGGTNPQNYYLRLNHSDAEQESVAPYDNAVWNNTAPTSTHFSLGPINDVNANNVTYIAMLFASVDGISKVGYFDGSNSDLTITTGFSPRFLIVKAASTTGQWNVLDTTRGWASGNDPYLKLNSTAAQIGSYDNGAPTATGFTLAGNNGGFNVSGVKYIYYAHA